MSNEKMGQGLIDFFKRSFTADVRIKIDDARNKEIIGNEYTVLSVNDEGQLLVRNDEGIETELNPYCCTFYKLNQPELVSTDKNGNEVTMTNVKEVAEYIISQGCIGETYIYEKDTGEYVLNTMGILLDHISDMDYRTELLAVLIPMQQNYANEVFGYSSSEDSESISEESDTDETEGLSMKM